MKVEFCRARDAGGRHRGGGVIKGLPNSNHRANYTLWDVGPQGVFVFRQATPPNESRVLMINRSVDYKTNAPGAVPVASTLRGALVQKFGTPSESRVINTFAEELIWVWDRQGKLQAQPPSAQCKFLAGQHFSQRTAPATELTRKVVEGGCATYVMVQILNEGTSVATKLEHIAVDVAGSDQASRVTEQAVRDYAQQQIDKKRKQAESQTPAI